MSCYKVVTLLSQLSQCYINLYTLKNALFCLCYSTWEGKRDDKCILGERRDPKQWKIVLHNEWYVHNIIILTQVSKYAVDNFILYNWSLKIFSLIHSEKYTLQ